MVSLHNTPLKRIRDELTRFAHARCFVAYKADWNLALEVVQSALGYIAEFDAHESEKHTEKHRQYLRDSIRALTREDDPHGAGGSTP